MSTSLYPRQSSSSVNQPEEWILVQNYLNECNFHKEFTTVAHFCKYIRGGDILCQFLQKAYFKYYQREDNWIHLCRKYNKKWPGYKTISNNLSDFIIEENANYFLTIVSQELNTPSKILFRADELRAMVDMHAVFKVLAYLSNQEFFKTAFPNAKPFRIFKRSSYDANTLNATEMSVESDVYAAIEPDEEGEFSIAGNDEDSVYQSTLKSNASQNTEYQIAQNYLAVCNPGNVGEIGNDQNDTNQIYQTLCADDLKEPAADSPLNKPAKTDSKKLNNLEKNLEKLTYAFHELFVLQNNFTENMGKLNLVKKYLKNHLFETEEFKKFSSHASTVFGVNYSNAETSIFSNLDEMVNAHSEVNKNFLRYLAEFDLNIVSFKPGDIRSLLSYSEYGLINPALYIDENYHLLCKAHMKNSGTITNCTEYVDKILMQFEPIILEALLSAKLKSNKIKEVLILPIIHMTKLPEVFKGINKILHKIKSLHESNELVVKQTNKYKVPYLQFIDSCILQNELAVQQIKSISMMNNKVKRDVDDEVKSKNISDRYPQLNGAIDLNFHGLCRLDSDLQYSIGNSISGKRRQVFLYWEGF